MDVVAVRVGVTRKRTLGQGLESLAGAIGVALLFPVAILIIGLPMRCATGCGCRRMADSIGPLVRCSDP